MANNKNIKYLNYLYVFIFVFILAFPHINSKLYIIQDFEFTEKRTLVQKPSIVTDDQAGDFIGFKNIINQLKDYPDKYKQYLSDNLNLRNRLISYNNLLDLNIRMANTQLFGYDVDSRGYINANIGDQSILTKDGWWWRSLPERWRSRGLFTQQELESYAKEIQARSDYLKKKGIIYVYGIYPGKRTIYPEYLPEGAKSVSARGRQILQYLETHTDVITVDPYDVIIEEKDNKAKEGKIIYKKTDTHWNSDGAFVGYTEVANVVKQYVDISVSTKDDFDITYQDMRGGDITKFISVQEYFPENNNPEYEYDGLEQLYCDYNCTISGVVNNISKDAPSAVIFGDSYTRFGSLLFFQTSFSRVDYKKSHIGFDVSAVEKYGPEVVIQAIVDYQLYDIHDENYFTQELYSE